MSYLIACGSMPFVSANSPAIPLPASFSSCTHPTDFDDDFGVG
jgi:hypothetical protein